MKLILTTRVAFCMCEIIASDWLAFCMSYALHPQMQVLTGGMYVHGEKKHNEKESEDVADRRKEQRAQDTENAKMENNSAKGKRRSNPSLLRPRRANLPLRRRQERICALSLQVAISLTRYAPQ